MINPQNEHDWVPVTTASGLYEADLIAADLRRAGIPARVVHESAGAALGLTTGRLGTISIQVPVSQETLARQILTNMSLSFEDQFDDAHNDFDSYNPDDGVPIRYDYGKDEPDLFSRISQGALLVAAIAFSPIGVILALITTWLSGRRKR